MAEEQKPIEDSDSLDAPASTDASTPTTPTSPTPTPEPIAQEAPEDSTADRLKSSFNIYFIIFIVLVIMTVGIIFYAVTSSRKQAKTTVTKAPSLTSEQLAQLKGNTTVVGDAKSTLDVQSNSIFEGQLFVRNDLSVSGTIKLGGNFNVPTLTVGGTGTYGGNLQAGKDFSVNGSTVLQGPTTIKSSLTVSGTASFGALAVGNLTASGLQLIGDITISRHIITNGTSVSQVSGTALGAGGTVSVSGTDTSGTIRINTGTNPPPGIFVTVNFGQSFGTVPRVLITPIGVSAGAVTYYVNRTPTSFQVGCFSAPPAGSSFAFDYFVIN